MSTLTQTAFSVVLGFEAHLANSAVIGVPLEFLYSLKQLAIHIGVNTPHLNQAMRLREAINASSTGTVSSESLQVLIKQFEQEVTST